MQPGKVKARERKPGAWSLGEEGDYYGVVDGRYVVVSASGIYRYRSESEVANEWEPMTFQLAALQQQGQVFPGLAPVRLHAHEWRAGDKLTYVGPSTQQLKNGDVGTYEGEHSRMDMVRHDVSGYVDSHSAQAGYHNKGIGRDWRWTSRPALQKALIPTNPSPPTLDIGQQLLVKSNVHFFDHLNSFFGAYEGITDDKHIVRLEEGGVARYATLVALLSDWQKPQSSKELCSYLGAYAVRRLTLEQYLAKEEDPAKREQAENFVAMSEPGVVFMESANGVIRMCSASVNDLVDHVDIEKCMAACNHEPVVAWPFCKLADGTKVFSSPPNFVIGRGNPGGYGYVYDEKSTKAALVAANIPQAVQDKIHHHMTGHAPPRDDLQLKRAYQQHWPQLFVDAVSDQETRKFFQMMYGKKK